MTKTGYANHLILHATFNGLKIKQLQIRFYTWKQKNL